MLANRDQFIDRPAALVETSDAVQSALISAPSSNVAFYEGREKQPHKADEVRPLNAH
jgi:hypothetical protein